MDWPFTGLHIAKHVQNPLVKTQENKVPVAFLFYMAPTSNSRGLERFNHISPSFNLQLH